MPRHSNNKGKVLPVPPLDMEEVKFWLQIMEEHALFIKTGLPCDKPDLIEEAAAFERELKALRVRAEKLSSEKKFAELIADILCSLKEFLRYKRLLLGLSLTNKLGSALPPLFFDHLVREAEYFMAILEKLRAGKKLSVVKAREADFWLRIMADHTKFIGARLDPTERSLLGVVCEFSTEFDDLTMQGRNYVGFFEHQAPELPAFGRFLQDSRSATARLRDFKQAAYDMITKNRMLSTIPALMADHVRREADHFLLILAMIEKCVIKEESPTKYTHAENIGMVVDNEFFAESESIVFDDWVEPERESSEKAIDNTGPEYKPEKSRKQIITGQTASDDSGSAVVDDTVAIPVDTIVFEPVSQEAVAVDTAIETKLIAAEQVTPAAKPPAPAEDGKQGKYKWGGKWPRQLGKMKN
ncbi:MULTISPECIES: DUF2935 domain-containing protein [Sporomusa]|jgi:hypothetical protein|uniref:DUF2935 domain-containing protein n=1 Tax=Sporomusa sphaeroides DSM 2875 TaxID=1337886 RepID=A0ABM9W9A5_9FIRM|nr:DUF2935 domain-containing protein [Sporomusa sphaeroides]OLS56248.1 hypothetical protein SPSPH_26390 [Sporomusa sphaeroides DSM 2875]CVK21756.1 hypothetical protein SSPH_04465 [Sporomusa sphaeroides DSM 2875]HML33937.1 DUF2935 domain-containing protein [Sporomusa sphaeroides]